MKGLKNNIHECSNKQDPGWLTDHNDCVWINKLLAAESTHKRPNEAEVIHVVDSFTLSASNNLKPTDASYYNKEYSFKM